MEYLIKLSQIRFEDTKGVIKGQNTDIQNTILSNMNRTKIKKMLRNDKQFMLHWRYPSCYSSYKSGDKSCMRKGLDSDYHKRNICVVICDTDIP